MTSSLNNLTSSLPICVPFTSVSCLIAPANISRALWSRQAPPLLDLPPSESLCEPSSQHDIKLGCRFQSQTLLFSDIMTELW